MRLLGKYVLNLLIAIDQLFNAILLGDPDETISSRVGKHYPNSDFAKLLNWLFFWDKGKHTTVSIEEDEGSDAVYKEKE